MADVGHPIREEVIHHLARISVQRSQAIGKRFKPGVEDALVGMLRARKPPMRGGEGEDEIDAIAATLMEYMEK